MYLSAIPILFLAALSGLAQPTFQSQSNLVVIPFHVSQGKYYVPNLKSTDFVLLEDGKPRKFTFFEAPGSTQRTLELVLLFDVTRAGKPFLPLESQYAFAPSWDEESSRSILENGAAGVQVSLFRFESNRIQRMSGPVDDPAKLVDAFQRVLTPLSATDSIPLTSPSNRQDRIPRETAGWGWTFEAILAALNDPQSAPKSAARAMVVFSKGSYNTTTTPEDVANRANALGIPLYPVVASADIPSVHATDGRPLDSGFWEQSVGTPKFRRLADLTGGSYFDAGAIDVKQMRDILQAIKNECLSEYVVGFVPASRAAKSQPHTLEIKLAAKSTGKLIGGKRVAAY
jgi:VWFA-related protein